MNVSEAVDQLLKFMPQDDDAPMEVCLGNASCPLLHFDVVPPDGEHESAVLILHS